MYVRLVILFNDRRNLFRIHIGLYIGLEAIHFDKYIV
jgi:hypothetical protein